MLDDPERQVLGSELRIAVILDDKSAYRLRAGRAASCSADLEAGIWSWRLARHREPTTLDNLADCKEWKDRPYARLFPSAPL